MHSTALRKAGALLLAGALVLFLAAPAAAAPARAAGLSQAGASFLQTFVAWLTAWWPGAPAGPTLTAAPAPLGPDIDPDGAKASSAPAPLGPDIDPSGAKASSAPAPLGPEADPEGAKTTIDWPVATPQLGAEPDPNG